MKKLHRFISRWQNALALFLVAFIVLVAVAAPLISPPDPKNPGPYKVVGRATDGKPHPPSQIAPLGMLPRGVDVFHSLVWGARGALTFGLTVTVFASVFGVLYGTTAGLAGGRLGRFLMNIADSMLAFPVIAGVVFLQQLYAATITSLGGSYYVHPSVGLIIELAGPMTAIRWVLQHVNPLMLSLILFSWMPYARLVQSTVMLLMRSEFIQAARTVGGTPWWIIRRHLIPNAISPVLVLAARDIGGVVLLQATFTFIRIGGDSVWGDMLALGRSWVLGPGGNLLTYWWVFLPPTVAVMFFGIAWNMLGDSLSDYLDPRHA